MYYQNLMGILYAIDVRVGMVPVSLGKGEL